MLGLSSSLLGLLWEYKLAVPLGIVVCLLVGALCGALNGFLIVRFRLPSLAVTIGTLALFRGFAYILLGDKAVADFPPEYAEFGIGVSSLHVHSGAVCAVYHSGARFFGSCFITPPSAAAFTRSGEIKPRRVFPGVNISRLKMLLFIISGMISALAGIVFTFRFSSSRADNGTGFELSAIAAVFLGGVTVQGGKGTVTGVVALPSVDWDH